MAHISVYTRLWSFVNNHDSVVNGECFHYAFESGEIQFVAEDHTYNIWQEHCVANLNHGAVG